MIVVVVVEGKSLVKDFPVEGVIGFRQSKIRGKGVQSLKILTDAINV